MRVAGYKDKAQEALMFKIEIDKQTRDRILTADQLRNIADQLESGQVDRVMLLSTSPSKPEKGKLSVDVYGVDRFGAMGMIRCVDEMLSKTR